MKKFIVLIAILSLVVVIYSCKLQDDESSNPVDPGTITLTVTNPTSGDTLYTSSVYNIKWTSNTTQNLIVEYTLDNGENWTLIATDVENSESYIWSPIPNTQTTQGRIKITTADSTLSSISEGFFSIVRGTTKTVTVIEPNGSEHWQGNSVQAIKWSSSGIDSVIIEYTLDNGLNWNTITTNAQSTGFYNWNPLPNTPTTNAKIRIIDADEGFPIDESDGLFTIEPSDILTVTMPNGSEEWLAGSSQYIKWNTLLDISPGSALPSPSNGELTSKNIKSKLLKTKSSGVEVNSSPNSIEIVESVKIEYSVNGAASWNTIIESTPNNGIYFWQSLPNENSANCLIRVSDAVDGVPFDFNDGVFSIFATLPQEIVVISPNGGEGWAAGTSQDITWNSKDVSFVKIEYTIDNGVSWTSIVESTSSDGFYTWEQLPNGAASNCRIKISDAVDGSPSDMSNDLFSITPEPSINLTSPNGGETLQSGSSINITWTSENIAQIKIEYTINGGAEWKLIANNIESTGTYTWENIPDVNSSQVRVKISDADDGAPSDISENNLAISNQIVQSLEVTSPNGNEFWEANTAKNITWHSSAVTHVKIEFTDNNGLDWSLVEDNLPSSGSYDWHVPNVNSTQAKIRVSDAVDGDPVDESNATFRIKQAGTIKLISPESGDNWIAGDLNRIEWEAKNIEKIKIEFTTTNAIYDPEAEWFDDAWFDLVTNTPGAAGFYETRFTIPSTEYRLRISDAEFNEPVDFSGLFTVKGQPSFTLQLTTPNGGENWIIGEPYEITWTSENVERISIDYSLNNGTTWNDIITDVPSNGLHNWVVPDIENRSDLCKIRIQQATDSTIFDLSDASFSIHPKDKLLRIVSPNGGEVWDTQLENTITWVTSGINNVNILYTIDNATTWNTIVSNLHSTGAYSWNPPDVASALARIKIEDSSDPTYVDESDSYFTLGSANEASISIISPNGGENLQANTSTSISWTSTNVKDIMIEFSKNNGAEWEIVVASTPSDGNHTWASVPDIYSELCAIRISDVSRNDVTSVSASTFTITNLVNETIKILFPNGGEEWEAGTLQNITWEASAITNVDLEYTDNNGNSWTTIVSSLPSTGAYQWTVPSDLNSPQSKIRIKDSDDGDPVDESDGIFTIKPKPSIRVTSPQGGKIYSTQEEVNITWESSGIDYVGIRYTTTNGIGSGTEPTFYTISTSTPNTGEFLTSFSIPSDKYFVEVYDINDQGVSNRSTGNFEVIESAIIILAPVGGVQWTTGETYEIQWTSFEVANVNIEYSVDGGASWIAIVSNKFSDGYYNWTIPNTISTSHNAIVKITDASAETSYAFTSSFSILQSSFVRVDSPNGGEEWEYLKGQRIDWTTSPNISNVDIYYSLNNGNTWEAVILGYPSYGAYEWNAPEISTSLGRIKIEDSNDPTVSDISDAPFKLIKTGDGDDPFITLLTPEQDVTWTIGSDQDITWFTHRDIVYVSIEVSYDNGTNWADIDANYTDTPWDEESSYTWTVVGSATSVAKIRMSGYDSNGFQLEEVISDPFNIQ